LFEDTGITELRINTPSLDYVDAIKAAMKHGVDRVHVTGYGGPGSASALSAGVKALIAKGVPVISCSLENEPDFKTWTDQQCVDGHKALRAALPASVAVVGPEFANTDGETLRCARLLRPLMPSTVQFFGHHSYGLGATEELSKIYIDKAPAGQFECGYMSFASLAARMLNDLNRGAARWTAHRAHQTRNTSDTVDRSQSLITYDGSETPWYHAMRLISLLFRPGTQMHLTTRKAAKPSDAEMMWRRDLTSPIYATAGRREGKWLVAAHAFSGGKQQVTMDVPGAKAGTWAGTRSNGTTHRPISVGGVGGRVRFTVPAGELVVLAGGG
jgi:hypothetical protein